MVKKVSMFTPTSCINISFNEGLWSGRVQFWGWSLVKSIFSLGRKYGHWNDFLPRRETNTVISSRNRGQCECSISSSRVGRYQNYQDGAVSNQLTNSSRENGNRGEHFGGEWEYLTVNVPVVYMELAGMILMRANPWQGSLEEVTPENRDFFGPWNGNERSECHLAQKVSIFWISRLFMPNGIRSPLSMALVMDLPASKSLRPAPYKQQVH